MISKETIEKSFEVFVNSQIETTIKHEFESLNNSFADGKWDGTLGYQPTQEQWVSSADYRKGYLEGIEAKLNEQYGLS